MAHVKTQVEARAGACLALRAVSTVCLVTWALCVYTGPWTLGALRSLCDMAMCGVVHVICMCGVVCVMGWRARWRHVAQLKWWLTCTAPPPLHQVQLQQWYRKRPAAGTCMTNLKTHFEHI